MDPRFWKPTRRFLLWFYDFIPKSLQEKYLGWMYPDDAIITFTGKSPTMKGRSMTVKDALDMENFEDLI